MALPKVKIQVVEGLQSLSSEIEKTPGIVITGTAVATKISIGESHQIFSLKEAEALGIEKDGDNDFAYKQIEAFYSQAGQGAPLWLMLVSDATSYETMADINENIAKKLIADAKGEIRVLGLLKKATGTESKTNGLDEDVTNALPKLQALCTYFASIYMPIRSVISGNGFTGTPSELLDYKTTAYDRVLMMIANTDASSHAAIGLLLGRLTKIPSQRSIARVKDGAIEPLQAYFTNGAKIESLVDSADAIHDKGLVFMRTFPGRSGYFFTDDNTLTNTTSDFPSLAIGLVMDEAVLITNDVLIEELSDEILLQSNGNIHPAVIKNWQQKILNQIEGLMVANGKLSGASVFIDENQNVLAENKIAVSIKLQPVGYAKTIEVEIGYTTQIEA